MTKIKANQLEIVEILNDPLAQATEALKGTLRIATQAEINGGSPYDNTIAVTPQTLAGFSGLPNNWLTANSGIDFTTTPSALFSNAIALGDNASAGHNNSVAIGSTATANGLQSIAIGKSAQSPGNGTVVLGTDSTTTAGASYSVAIGKSCPATLANQVVIGNHLTSLVYNTDVVRSVKIGYAAASAPNLLHLFSDGKLELYGDEAQFIMPNYSPTGSPATALPSTTNQGGTIYDFDTKTLKFYNGTAWTELNSNNWISANSDSNFAISPTTSALNAIAIGNNAQVSATAGIAIGSDVTASINSVSLGINSDTLGTGSVAIGNGAQSGAGGAGGTVAIGESASALKIDQISIGHSVTAASVSPTDVNYSVKIGSGATGTNKNMLHLFSKGKLELYGEEAQFIFPNYQSGSPITDAIPSTTIEGGTIWDSSTKELKVYNGATFAAVGIAGSGISAVVEDTSPQLGGHLDVNGYQINTPAEAGDADSGTITIRPGNANWVGAGSRFAGNLFVGAGYATSDNHGGSTTVAAGKALGTGAGGNVTITGGSTTYGTVAGTISLKGGDSTYSGNGGVARFTGGASYSGLFGGDVFITGGESYISGGGSGGTGGVVIIQGGRAYGGSPIGNNGDVIITAGEGAGNPGSIRLHTATTQSGPSSLQFWNYTDDAHTVGMYVALEAPAGGSPAVWSDFTLVLPNADGTNGEVIQTDGSGILSFADLKHLSINAQTITEYTLVLTDDGKLVTMDNSSPNELIIPTNASVAFPIGTQILVEQEGTGTTTFSGGGSPPPVTIHSPGDLFDAASQYTTISLIKKATDTWLIIGDLV